MDMEGSWVRAFISHCEDARTPSRVIQRTVVRLLLTRPERFEKGWPCGTRSSSTT
jgi:hypothetical protein